MANSLHVKPLLAPSLLGCCLAAALVFTPTHRAEAQASEFFDAFFSDNAGQPAQNFKGFIQWNVTDPANATNSSVDFVGGNVPGSFFYPTGRFVDLGGSTGQPAIFSTKLPIVLVLGMSLHPDLPHREHGSGPGSRRTGRGHADHTDSGRPAGHCACHRGRQHVHADHQQQCVPNLHPRFHGESCHRRAGLAGPRVSRSQTGVTRYDNSGVGLDLIAVTPQGVPAIPEPTAWVTLALGMGWVVARYALRRTSR